MPKKGQVKCPVCGQMFMKDEIPNKHFKNRYYHIDCFEKVNKNEIVKEKIYEKMRRLLGDSFNQNRIAAQIKKYTTENNYSIVGIYRALCYWYDVKNSDPSRAKGGIGIVPFIYQDAADYYAQLEQINIYNKTIDILMKINIL